MHRRHLYLRRDIPSERHDRYTRVIKVLPASEPDLSVTVECKAVFRRQRLRREDTASDADREKDDGEHQRCRMQFFCRFRR